MGDTLWTKGEKSLQRLQQQHTETVSRLECKLSACQDAQRQLEVENATIRDRLETLCAHLVKLLGHTDFADLQALFAEVAAVQPGVTRTVPSCPGPGLATSAELADTGSFHTPTNRGLVGNFDKVVGSPIKSPSGDMTVKRGSYVTSVPKMGAIEEVPVFSLTLRRVESVPLGLEWRDDEGTLTVEAVTPGSTVDAWNRQCSGETREIRAGDRLVTVNGSSEVQAMRLECRQKLLLKLTVERSDEAECATHTGESRYALGADAEFVHGGPKPH